MSKTQTAHREPVEPARPLPGSGITQAAPETAPLSTVVASMPGVAEQSLRAALESLPLIQVIGTAAGCLSALQMVRTNQADLVVVDSNLPLEDVQALLAQLGQDGLRTYTLVLVATNSQVRRALAAGAHVALRRDVPIGQLNTAIARFQRPGRSELEEAESKVLGPEMENPAQRA